MPEELVPSRAAQKQPAFAKVDKEWLHLPLSGTEFKVLVCLSLHANWATMGLGRCFPKRETLARECGIQVSQVSEALRKLTALGVITAVRLGRKNIYYVRPVGERYEMPPSNPEPFFAHIAASGIRVQATAGGGLSYAPGSKHFEDFQPVYRAVFDDYVRGLTATRLAEVLTYSRILQAAA